MADVFDTGSAPGCQFKIPAFPNPKPRPDPAPSPPDEGVDPFGVSRKIPPEPGQPAPLLLVPSPKPGPPVADSATTPDHGETTIEQGDSPRKDVARTGPDAQSEFSRPQFVGDDAQLAEIEREQMVARKVALRKYLRGEQIPPESRRLVREALGISNDDAAHLGLSDFSTETCQGRRDMILGHVVEQSVALGVGARNKCHPATGVRESQQWMLP